MSDAISIIVEDRMQERLAQAEARRLTRHNRANANGRGPLRAWFGRRNLS